MRHCKIELNVHFSTIQKLKKKYEEEMIVTSKSPDFLGTLLIVMIFLSWQISGYTESQYHAEVK
ncbi:847_t:CDS:2 [Entrophospora sp. SA101]|nr:847_t:CDS:2 [Entrophospora sp. SA101]